MLNSLDIMSYYRDMIKGGGNVAKGRICNACKQEIQRDILDRNHSICPQCGYYMRMHARNRIVSLADKESFREWNANMELSNPLNDSEYAKKSAETAVKHKLNDAIITGEMNIDGSHVAIGVMDTIYMMASMGYVVGEKVTRLFEKAKKKRLPVIIFCCSGGARMQEGIISLMQMEKTAAAVRLHSEAGLLYISVLTNPTMGVLLQVLQCWQILYLPKKKQRSVLQEKELLNRTLEKNYQKISKLRNFSYPMVLLMILLLEKIYEIICVKL